MNSRLLLDTHILLRWHTSSKQLSREQIRAIEKCAVHKEPLAISAVTLIEIALLVGDGNLDIAGGMEGFFAHLHQSPLFQILPITFEIAAGLAYLGMLRDPFDRTIVATARVHRLQLVTSDQRIAASKLVPVID